MNARKKSALLIVGTLLVGIALGVLATNFVVNRRLEQMRQLRSQRGYLETIVETIQPSSDAQRAQIEGIIRGTHERMNQLRRDWSAGMRVEGDSMRTMLREVLSSDQNERLDEWFSRYQRTRRTDSRRSDGRNSERRGSRSDSSVERSNRSSQSGPGER